MINTDTYYMYN